MISKDLIIPIYDCMCTVVVAEDFDAACTEAGYQFDTKGASAICLHYPDSPSNFTIVFREGAISPGSIAHEAFHLTGKIMSHIDVEYSKNSEEAYAYLIGFIVDGISQIVLEHPERAHRRRSILKWYFGLSRP